MRFPTKVFDTLWHVGTLDASDKRHGSLEGAGLSVSQHPDEWERIARLGGNSVWELCRLGACFVDAYAMSDEQWSVVLAWGTEQGLCRRGTGWRVSWWDDDLDDDVSFMFASFDAASNEVSEGTTEPIEVKAWLPTARLQEVSMWATLPDLVCVRDLVLADWAAREPRFAGVWWDDLLAPDLLSAPRGVIPKEQLGSWSVTRLR